MTLTRDVLLRVLEEVLPVATFFPRHRKKISAAAAAEDPVRTSVYEVIDIDELEAMLKDDQARAAALDEKSFKLSLSLSVALTILGTLSPLLLDRIEARSLLYVCAALMMFCVGNALIGGYIALGSMVALPSYGRGSTLPPKKASGARRLLLASSLARNELVGIAKALRNKASYQHLRNAVLCLMAALAVYGCGLPFGATTLKPPAASSAIAAPPPPGAASSAARHFDPTGTTLALAQAATWLREDTFAAGRWDGTISVFRTPRDGETGPVVVAAMAVPSGKGVEMVARIDDQTLASSDGPGRLAIWRQAGDRSIRFLNEAAYDPAFGPAESAMSLRIGSDTLFTSGHADGHVLVWQWTANALRLIKVLDVRSPGSPSNPWGLRNVRGMQLWRGETLVVGSEDGDLVGLHMPDGREIFRTRYNSTAQRGINGIAIRGDDLLVANCAVGASDRNLWLFDLSRGHPTMQDSVNLILDSHRAQVFDFGAILTPGTAGGTDFMAATEEGVIWQGRIDHGHITLDSTSQVATEGAAAIAASPSGAVVSTISGSIRLFKPE